MRLPFTQIASEVIEHGAADLALMLDWTEEAAGWGLVKLFDWALKRCPDHIPPSWGDTVRGPFAARMVSRAARWAGDPDAFIKACEVLPEPPLVRMPNGDIRIRGLKRYDRAWKKNNGALWKKLQEMTGADEDGRIPDGEVPETGTKPARVEPDSCRYTQTQIHTQKQKEETYVRPPDPVSAMSAVSVPSVAHGAEPDRRGQSSPLRHVPGIPEKPDKPEGSWDGMDFWAWAQAKRREAGLQPERRPNERTVSVWWSHTHMQGATPKALRRAFIAFGNDPFWTAKDKRPPVPFGGFISQWERFVEPGDVHASG